MWRGANSASELKIGNVAFLRTRIEFINSFFASGEVDEIWITFPDPHPGKKNSNKRLTCPWFLNKYSNLLKEGGTIHLKTDNTELYNYTRKLAEDNGLEILFSTNDIHSMSSDYLEVSGNIPPYNDHNRNKIGISAGILSIRTHYETKFLEKGHTINYLAFRPEKTKEVSHGWEKTKG